jgi:hypothetical protein
VSKRQPDLFEAKKAPNDSHGVIDPKAELYTDGVFRVPGSQAPLDFAVPFTESRSMKLQSLECDARSERACETFEETFAKGQPEGEDDSSAD